VIELCLSNNIHTSEDFLKLAFVDLLKVATSLPMLTYLAEDDETYSLSLLIGVEIIDFILKRISTVEQESLTAILCSFVLVLVLQLRLVYEYCMRSFDNLKSTVDVLKNLHRF